jgi:murein DD-endopeptidase MepM/ murein hydrolase activator NlpD
MMSKKRLSDSNNQDVFSKNVCDTETVKKRMTFSKAMIRLGAYVTYCLIFLLKKLNKMFCDAAKAFTSKTTALILGVIRKFKRIGRLICVPFVACIRPLTKGFKAKRAKTDMTVSSIRTTAVREFMSKAANYAVPAAAVVVFATVINSASKIDKEVSTSYVTGQVSVTSVNEETFIAATNELGYAEEISEKSISDTINTTVVNRSVSFEEPYELFDKLVGTDDMSLVSSVGIYIDNEFIGAVIDDEEIKVQLDKKLEEIKSDPSVKDAVYKKSIEYREGNYATSMVVDTENILEYINGGTQKSYYTVEAGDSLIYIAEQHNITFEELMAMNPEITDPDLCVIGTQLAVACDLDNMPVIVTKTIQETVSVPYETMTVDTDSLFVGESEVLIDGVCGEAVNTVDIRYEGETEVERTIVSSNVTKEPVAEMLAVGTKQCTNVAVPSSTETVLNGNGQFMWPVNGGYISDTFISDRNHKGLDIAAAGGTAIYAAAAGTVVAAGWNTGGYGYFVMIDHGDGYATLYAHMSKVIATNGATVNCGDLIGEVGTTGDSTGNHLHFEVRYNNVCQNPANYISVNATPAAVTDEQ